MILFCSLFYDVENVSFFGSRIWISFDDYKVVPFLIRKMCDIDSSKTYLFWNRNPVQTSKHIVEVVFFGSEILLSEGQTVTRLLSCFTNSPSYFLSGGGVRTEVDDSTLSQIENSQATCSECTCSCSP